MSPKGVLLHTGLTVCGWIVIHILQRKFCDAFEVIYELIMCVVAIINIK